LKTNKSLYLVFYVISAISLICFYKYLTAQSFHAQKIKLSIDSTPNLEVVNDGGVVGKSYNFTISNKTLILKLPKSVSTAKEGLFLKIFFSEDYRDKTNELYISVNGKRINKDKKITKRAEINSQFIKNGINIIEFHNYKAARCIYVKNFLGQNTKLFKVFTTKSGVPLWRTTPNTQPLLNFLTILSPFLLMLLITPTKKNLRRIRLILNCLSPLGALMLFFAVTELLTPFRVIIEPEDLIKAILLYYALVAITYTFFLTCNRLLRNRNKKEGEAKFRPINIKILVFLVVFIGHFSSPTSTSFDSRWSIHTALSITKNHDLNLDEYADIIKSNKYYGVVATNDHIYNWFPIGTPIMAVPLVYIIDAVGEPLLSFNLREHVRQNKVQGVEIFIASFIVALTSLLIYLISRFFIDDKKYSLLLVFIFAFCTSSWSIASRALWQHGPSMLMLATALYLVKLAEKKPYLIQFVSIPLAFSYVVRPTNTLSIVFLAIFVLIKYREYFLKSLLWASTIAIPFLLSNLAVYNSFLSPYYLPSGQHGNWTFPYFLEALAGNLISPSRGLFVYSPILLFSIYGFILKIRGKQLLDYLLACIMILHLLAISSFSPLPQWWGGHSFGPRLLCDMLPYLMYFLIPAVEELAKSRGRKKTALVFTFCCFIMISFFIHYRGATTWDVWEWNGIPINVDLNPKRLWDWKDAQFLRGM